MLRVWGRLSIKRKLQGIIMLTVAASLLLVCGVLLASSLIETRLAMESELELLARMTAQNSTAALSFSDRKSAHELLQGLRHQRSLVAGFLYSSDGSVFASYFRPD